MDVKEEEGIYNLHIKNVNFQDEGEFQCQVSLILSIDAYISLPIYEI